MIHIIVGGKKHLPWAESAIKEYEKRLTKPFDIKWDFLPEEKLEKYLEKWPFSGKDFVICCDERGKNISSREYSELLQTAQLNNKNIIILIGGAYGFTEKTRQDSDFIWGFSNLVFPHNIARLIVAEQTYRAQEILKNHPYHHE